MSLAMPDVMGSGSRRTGRRGSTHPRPDLRRSGRPALFDRSEAVGALPRVRTGTTVGEDSVGESTAVDGAAVKGAVIEGTVVDGAVVEGTVVDGAVVGSAVPTAGEASGPGTRRRSAVPAAPVPPAARALLADASLGLSRACAAGDPSDRYAIAHLAALRGAAAVLAARARPTRGQRGSVWTLITRVAPEFAEWASFFAAGSAKRQAVQAGLPAGVTAREADDLVRQVALFLSLVGDVIGTDR